MENIITAISKFAPADISMDYERLRTEGIQHLEELATHIWTDFNAHDPGITILEVLCYAITDLGYRANLPIEDLLATGNNSVSQQFFSADTILPICPVTSNDYRKVLIDFPGVRNAWIEKIYPKDFPIFLQEELVTIKELITDAFISDAIGLTDGDTNNDDLLKTVFYESIKSILHNRGFSLTAYREISTIEKIDDKDVTQAMLSKTEIFVTKLKAAHSFYSNFATIVYKRTFQEGANKLQISEEVITSKKLSSITRTLVEETDLTNFNAFIALFIQIETIEEIPIVVELLDEWLCKYSYFDIKKIKEEGYEPIDINGLYRICLDTHQNIDPDSKAAKRLIEKIKRGYIDETTKKEYKGVYAYRNLCEDFYDIQISPIQEICFCLNITIESEADENEVMANVFFRLQEFLTPTIQFQTFQQLLEKGKSCDEIFNGPLLCNGFIEAETLEAAVIPEEIRLSDLYKIILETPLVEAINELKIKKKGENDFKEDWCFKYREVSENACPIKPIIDFRCSSMVARKNEITHIILEKDILDVIELLRLGQRNLSGNSKNRPSIPKGTNRPDLEEYLSIQYEFPHNYIIGDNGLPNNAAPLRRAQVKQLQTYLLFYDQLLAAYLTQLGKVQDLLSVNQDVDTPTYFYQALYEVPGIRDLIKDQTAIQTEEDWVAYQADEDNYYIQELKKIAEGDHTQFQRKHRLLNHLLARFGEQFTDYTTSVFETKQKHLAAKIEFLKNVPDLGLEKAKAYNYRAKDEMEGDVDVWNTTNVSGLKKRIYGLLGWGNATTESVFSNPVYRLEKEEDRRKDLPYQFIKLYKLKEDGQLEEMLLASKKSYSPRKVKKIMPELYIVIDNQENYKKIQQVQEDQFKVVFNATIKVNKKEEIIELASVAMSEKEAQSLLEQITTLINAKIKGGFHLIEHLLLRPNDKEDELLQMSYTCDLSFSPVDPYSFWLTVIVPAWKDQFKDAEYRAYFMQLFRRETPAHIAICFRWVEKEDTMQKMEHALEQWREAYANCSPNECEITTKANDLILQLNDLPCDCFCFFESTFTTICKPEDQRTAVS